jgi:hypothetical protein
MKLLDPKFVTYGQGWCFSAKQEKGCQQVSDHGDRRHSNAQVSVPMLEDMKG